MANKIDNPHISLPFRLNRDGTALEYTEQDSLEEIAECVEAIIRCPLGHRDDLPAFGTPDQAFTEGGADVGEIERSVELWEPRAAILLAENPDALDEAISRVTANVHGREQ